MLGMPNSIPQLEKTKQVAVIDKKKLPGKEWTGVSLPSYFWRASLVTKESMVDKCCDDKIRRVFWGFRQNVIVRVGWNRSQI
jgi:hypothetical protein